PRGSGQPPARLFRPDHAAVERGGAGQSGPWRLGPCRDCPAPRAGTEREFHPILPRPGMARRRLLRRRVPDGGPRGQSVRPGRGKPFHYFGNAAVAAVGGAPEPRTDSGMPRAYAEVIGDPVDQSLSPAIHEFWLKALSIDAGFGRRRVTRPELPAYFAEPRADPAWGGSNVTMRLKLDAVALADGASDRAVAAGAANLLMMRDGRLTAANTDVGAIVTLLGKLHEAKPLLGGVTLLGNGGAARAALVALKLVG